MANKHATYMSEVSGEYGGWELIEAPSTTKIKEFVCVSGRLCVSLYFMYIKVWG